VSLFYETPDRRAKLYLGDARHLDIPDESIDMIATSPPYFGKRDYGEDVVAIWGGEDGCEHIFNISIRRPGDKSGPHGPGSILGAKLHSGQDDPRRGEPTAYCSLCGAWRGQLGLEPTWQEYITHLCECAREWWRVLKPTGNLFVNMGDTFHGGKGASGQGSAEYQAARSDVSINKPQDHIGGPGLTRPQDSGVGIPKMKLGIPYRLRFALNDMGWVSRADIIWYKGKRYPDGKITKVAMPESVKDRMSCSYEMLFHFVKEPKRYWFDLDAVRRPHLHSSLMRDKYAYNAAMGARDKVPSETREGRGYVRAKTADESSFKPPGTLRQAPEPGEPHAFHPAGANPGDLFFIPPEEDQELIPFPFEVHWARLGVQEFKNLSAIASRTIGQLESASSAMLSRLLESNPDDGEFIRNFIEELVCASKPDGKPTVISGQAYATITVEQAPNEVRIEFGRNRWILRSLVFPGDDIQGSQILRHHFAINLDSMSPPSLAPVNWIRGIPLPYDVLYHLNVLRRKTDCITGASDFDATITYHQSQEISGVMSNRAKVFLLECVLAIALNQSRVAMAIPTVPVHPAESSALARFLAIINLTDTHASIIADSGAEVKTPGDVWIIQPEPFKEAHYAVWPSKLCERMIKVGCPKEVCPKCGKPRERITNVEYEVLRKSQIADQPKVAGQQETSFGARNEGFRFAVGKAHHHTIGWSDCGCGEGFVPGICLDPFGGGSGRLQERALFLGRDTIMVDMKREYLEMAKSKLLQGVLL